MAIKNRFASETYVNDIIENNNIEINNTINQLQQGKVDQKELENYALKNEIPTVPVQSVNGKTGAVQLSASEVGALPNTTKIPANTSDLTNNSGFITKTVTDLANYYLKTEVYTQDEIDNKLSAIPKFAIEVVSTLPTANISETTVYLVASGNEEHNLYTEYIYVDGQWEYLGKQTVDLTNYVKRAELSNYYLKTEMDSLLTTIRNSIPTQLSQLTEDSTHRVVTDAEKQTWNAKSNFSGSYNDLTNKPTIPSLTGYAKTADHYTKTESDNKYQSKGNYLTEVPSEYITETELTAKGYAKTSQIPVKTSQLTNDSNFATTSDITNEINKFGGTVEITSANPTKENTVLTINPNAEEVQVYTVEEVDDIVEELSQEKIGYNDLAEAIENEKGNIVNSILEALQGLPVFGVVDENNTITVTSQLSGGTYTLMYENEDGTLLKVGTITVESGKIIIVNLLESAIGAQGTVLNDVGYADGYYLSGNANVSENNSYLSTDATHFTTGCIPYTKAQAEAGVPIYVKGITLDTSQSHTRMCAYPNYDYSTYLDPIKFSAGDSYISVETLGDKYYKITPKANFISTMNNDFKYVRFSFTGSGNGVIITVDQEIVDSEIEEPETYKNWIKYSVDATGADYVGHNGEDGYSVGYRVNSSGVEEAVSGMCCTGYIPYDSETIRLKNVTIAGTKTPYIAVYLGDKTFQQVVSLTDTLKDDGTGVYTGSVSCREKGWIRITCGVIDDTSILTINEAIADDGTSTSELFVPTTCTLNARLGSSGSESSQNSTFITDYIDIGDLEPSGSRTILFSGFQIQMGRTSSPYTGIEVFDASKTRLGKDDTEYNDAIEYDESGTKTFKATVNNPSTSKTARYIRVYGHLGEEYATIGTNALTSTDQLTSCSLILA